MAISLYRSVTLVVKRRWCKNRDVLELAILAKMVGVRCGKFACENSLKECANLARQRDGTRMREKVSESENREVCRAKENKRKAKGADFSYRKRFYSSLTKACIDFEDPSNMFSSMYVFPQCCTHRKIEKEIQLAHRRKDGREVWGRSQIRGPQETRVLYKLFNTLCLGLSNGITLRQL